jgi:PilZ domain
LQTGAGTKTADRRFPRFLMEVDVNVYSKKNGLAPGRTVDISESGISAVVPVELSIGETVEMDIRFPLEATTVTVVVRNRNVFRYGFEFDQSKMGKELTGKELVSRAPGR